MLNIFSKTALGIDVTDLELRLIYLSKKGKNINLEGYNELPLSPGIVENGNIVDYQKFSENIKKLIEEIHGNNKIIENFISAIPEKKTFTILINNNEKIKNNNKNNPTPQIIIKEIEKRIPLSLDNIYFDWQITLKNKILLTAASKKIINNYISAFKSSNIILSKIDIKPAAIIRAITPLKNTNNKIIINIDDKNSTIILGNSESIELVISLSFNNSIVNDILQNKLKLSKNQTKKAKIVCGVNDKKCHGAIKKVLEPQLEEISKKIKEVINYHKNNFPQEKSLDKIILCGEGSNLKDIDVLLTKKLKIESIIGNTFININNTNNLLDNKKALKFTQAIGMALGGLI